ncbi:MAG: hypothetical protein OIF57_01195 [Marinobacterium sp.]|nr:hypothetical protein [Marinobacterium sp.]
MTVTRSGRGVDVPGKKKERVAVVVPDSNPSSVSVPESSSMSQSGAGAGAPAGPVPARGRQYWNDQADELRDVVNELEALTGNQVPSNVRMREMVTNVSRLLYYTLDRHEETRGITREGNTVIRQLCTLARSTPDVLATKTDDQLTELSHENFDEMLRSRMTRVLDRISVDRRRLMVRTLLDGLPEYAPREGGAAPVARERRPSAADDEPEIVPAPRGAEVPPIRLAPARERAAPMGTPEVTPRTGRTYAAATYDFPRKVKEKWAVTLKPGITYGQARVYLDDVTDYVNLPPFRHLKDDMDFLRMIMAASMNADAQAQCRAAMDPSQSGGALIYDWYTFSGWVESAFINNVPAFVRTQQLQDCKQKVGETFEAFYSRFTGMVAGCDPPPTESTKAALFLTNATSLPYMTQSRLRQDVALNRIGTLAEAYAAAQVVLAMPGMTIKKKQQPPGLGGPGRGDQGGRGGPGRGDAGRGGRGAAGGRGNLTNIEEMTCYWCHEKGHLRRDCPKWQEYKKQREAERRVNAHEDGGEQAQGGDDEAEEGANEMNVLRLGGDGMGF